MSDEGRSEDDLTERLEKLSPAELEEARKRAVTAARVQMSNRPEQRPRARRLLNGRAVALAGSAVLAILLLSTLTAPGQAVAEWVGQRFGIGQPGGEPTMRAFREFVKEGSAGEGLRDYVIATGSSEIGGRFEIVTNASLIDGNHCFALDMVTERSTMIFGDCRRLATEKDVTFAYEGAQFGYAGDRMDPDQRPLQRLGGRVSTDIDTVEITFRGEPVEVQLLEPSPEVLELIGIDQPFKVYLGFTTDFLHGGLAIAKGYNSAGELVATRRRPIPDRVTMGTEACQGFREKLSRWKHVPANDKKSIDMLCDRAKALASAPGQTDPGS